MRGLLMALFAFDFPGHNVDHWAGADRARENSRITKTMAKTTTKTV